MDPDATLRLISEYLNDNEDHEAYMSCEDLYKWIEKGGYKPNWNQYPNASKVYKSWAKAVRG